MDSDPWMFHVVRQGETLTSLAARRQVDRDTIWTNTANLQLAGLRKNPDVLFPGDIISLPSPRREFLPVTMGGKNVFVGNVQRALVQVKVPAFAGASYTATAAGETLPPGSVGTDGKLSLSVVVSAQRVDVTFTSPAGKLSLLVGHLDPVETSSGLQQRLHNLGIPIPDAELDTEGHGLRRAIAVFQHLAGLAPTGEADDDTRAELMKRHAL